MTPPAKRPFDPTTWIRRGLLYQKYLRLMAILFCLGLSAALGYYIYATPVYYSRALIHAEGIKTAADNTGGTYLDAGLIPRMIAGAIGSQASLVRVARRLGVADERTSFEYLRDTAIPKFGVSYLDRNTIQIEVYSYYPKVVRELPTELIEQYREDRTSSAEEFRALAVDRYVSELEDLRLKLEERLGDRLEHERSSALTEVQMRQLQLSQVPYQLEVARFNAGELASVLDTLDSQGERLGTVGQLSLISSYRATRRAQLGRLVRSDAATAAPLPNLVLEEQGPEGAARVVVQPEQAEDIEAWRTLERERRSLERGLERARETFLENHQVVVGLKDQIDRIGDELQTELEVERARLDLERAALQEDVTKLEGKMEDYYTATADLDRERLNFNLFNSGGLPWTEAYESIAKDLSRFEAVSDLEPFVLRFDSFLSLRDRIPMSPNKSKLAMLGLLLGVGLALGVPFLIESLDDSSSTLTEFEAETGLPGIGLVPLTDPALLEEVVRSPSIGAKVPNYLLENFRVIRSNLILHPGRKGKTQVVMVTSSRPSEGKTTGAANLAWSFYSMGERTLLVDCDLRRGRVHQLLKLDNSKGLTTFFSGSSTIDEVIQPTAIENLMVIPRGPVIVGTTESLCAQVFANLVERWRGEYDRIVLDTPPILGLSETTAIQRVSDGVLLVIQAGKTARKDVRDAVGLLRKSGAHIFGFTLNRVDLSKMFNYYNYYYYSAHYYDSFTSDEDPIDPPSQLPPAQPQPVA